MTKRRSSALAGTSQTLRVKQDTRVATDAVRQPALLADVSDSVVRATCLAAVVVVPLYFSLLTTSGVETDKAVLLIALATVAGGAWLIGTLDRTLRRATVPSFGPLLWLGLSVFAAYALATVFSIHPAASLFGSLARHQGLLTHAGYVVFFVCVATRFRRRSEIDLLIATIVFASVPAVVYGLVQQFGFDPTPTTGDPATIQWPVRSSFGQHVFFGAYLVLVIPLTAARLMSVWEQPVAATPGSQSRAPLLVAVLPWIAGASFVGLLALAHHVPAVFVLFPLVLAGYALWAAAGEEVSDSPNVRRVRLWGYGVLLALQIVVLLLTSARGPWMGFFASLVTFGVLAAWWLGRRQVARTMLGVAVAATLLVLALNISGGPLQSLRSVHVLHRISHLSESGGNDSSAQGRLLIWQGIGTLMTQHPGIGNTWGGIGRDVIGYGPEGLDQAFEAVFPLKLRQLTSQVYTWDRAHDIYLDTLVDAGALGLLLLIATIVLFFSRMYRFLTSRRGLPGWLSIGLTSAVVGHLVEGVFGLETAASLLLLWTILGLGASVPADNDESAEEVTHRSSWLSVSVGYWGALLLVTGLVLLFPSLPDHPTLLASLWTAGIVASIGTITRGLLPRTAAPPATRGGRPAPLSTSPISGGAWAATGAIVLVAFLALLSQWEFENAAASEPAGFRNLTNGRVHDGIADLQQAVQFESDTPRYWESLASVYLGLSATKSLSSEPGYVFASDAAQTIDPNIVLTLDRNQLLTLAVQSLQRARDTAPLDPSLWQQLGLAYLQWKRPALAYAAFQQAERLSLHNPKYLDDQAGALLALGHKSAALGKAQAALRLDPKYWYTHYALAFVYHSLKQPTQARREAALGLFWEPVFWPPPPKDQITRLRRIERTG